MLPCIRYVGVARGTNTIDMTDRSANQSTYMLDDRMRTTKDKLANIIYKN